MVTTGWEVLYHIDRRDFWPTVVPAPVPKKVVWARAAQPNTRIQIVELDIKSFISNNTGFAAQQNFYSVFSLWVVKAGETGDPEVEYIPFDSEDETPNLLATDSEPFHLVWLKRSLWRNFVGMGLPKNIDPVLDIQSETLPRSTSGIVNLSQNDELRLYYHHFPLNSYGGEISTFCQLNYILSFGDFI